MKLPLTVAVLCALLVLTSAVPCPIATNPGSIPNSAEDNEFRAIDSCVTCTNFWHPQPLGPGAVLTEETSPGATRCVWCSGLCVQADAGGNPADIAECLAELPDDGNFGFIGDWVRYPSECPGAGIMANSLWMNIAPFSAPVDWDFNVTSWDVGPFPGGLYWDNNMNLLPGFRVDPYSPQERAVHQDQNPSLAYQHIQATEDVFAPKREAHPANRWHGADTAMEMCLACQGGGLGTAMNGYAYLSSGGFHPGFNRFHLERDTVGTCASSPVYGGDGSRSARSPLRGWSTDVDNANPWYLYADRVFDPSLDMSNYQAQPFLVDDVLYKQNPAPPIFMESLLTQCQSASFPGALNSKMDLPLNDGWEDDNGAIQRTSSLMTRAYDHERIDPGYTFASSFPTGAGATPGFFTPNLPERDALFSGGPWSYGYVWDKSLSEVNDGLPAPVFNSGEPGLIDDLIFDGDGPSRLETPIDTDCSDPDDFLDRVDNADDYKLWVVNSPEMCSPQAFPGGLTQGISAVNNNFKSIVEALNNAEVTSNVANAEHPGTEEIIRQQEDIFDPYYTNPYTPGLPVAPVRLPCPAGTYHANPAWLEDLNVPIGILPVQSSTSDKYAHCYDCPEGTFSFEGYTQCYPCPSLVNQDTGATGANCTNGVLTANPGFWCERPFIPHVNPTPRAGESFYFDTIAKGDGGLLWTNPLINRHSVGVDEERRMTFRIRACLGDELGDKCRGGPCCYDVGYGKCPSCAPERSGALCESCAANHYALSGDCLPCPTIPSEILMVGGFIVFGILVYVLFRAPKGSAGFFRLSVDFFQVTSIFPSFSVPWPSPLLWVFSWFSFFNLDIGVAAPECTLETFRDPVKKYVYTLMAPLFILGAFIVIAMIRRFYRRFLKVCVRCGCMNPRQLALESTSELINRGVRGFVSFFLLAFLFLSVQSLSILDCARIDPEAELIDPDAPFNLEETLNGQVWERYPQSLCWFRRFPGQEDVESAWEQSFFPALFSIIVYVVFMPLLLGYLMRKNALRMENPVVNKRLGALWSAYAPAHYDWEIKGVLSRKFILACLGLFLTNHPVTQVVCATAVLTVYLLLAVRLQPYRYTAHNRLHTTLLAVQTTLALTGTAFALGWVGTPKTDSTESEVLLFYIVSTLSVCIVLSGIGLIFLVGMKELRFKMGNKLEIVERKRDEEERKIEAERLYPQMHFNHEDPDAAIKEDLLKKLDKEVEEAVKAGKPLPTAAIPPGKEVFDIGLQRVLDRAREQLEQLRAQAKEKREAMDAAALAEEQARLKKEAEDAASLQQQTELEELKAKKAALEAAASEKAAADAAAAAEQAAAQAEAERAAAEEIAPPASPAETEPLTKDHAEAPPEVPSPPEIPDAPEGDADTPPEVPAPPSSGDDVVNVDGSGNGVGGDDDDDDGAPPEAPEAPEPPSL